MTIRNALIGTAADLIGNEWAEAGFPESEYVRGMVELIVQATVVSDEDPGGSLREEVEAVLRMAVQGLSIQGLL